MQASTMQALRAPLAGQHAQVARPVEAPLRLVVPQRAVRCRAVTAPQPAKVGLGALLRVMVACGAAAGAGTRAGYCQGVLVRSCGRDLDARMAGGLPPPARRLPAATPAACRPPPTARPLPPSSCQS